MRKALWKEAAVTIERLRRSLRYVPETGDLVWKERPGDLAFNSRFAGRKAGSLVRGYLMITFGPENARVYVHRIVMALATGRWPEGEVDHIDGDKTNNRLENPRHATSRENGRNKRSVLGEVPLKGVTFERELGKYRARIKTSEGRKSLGLFSEAKTAAEAYDRAALSAHGEFAVTNASLGLIAEVAHA